MICSICHQSQIFGKFCNIKIHLKFANKTNKCYIANALQILPMQDVMYIKCYFYS